MNLLQAAVWQRTAKKCIKMYNARAGPVLLCIIVKHNNIRHLCLFMLYTLPFHWVDKR